jgi:hypothetical protein
LLLRTSAVQMFLAGFQKGPPNQKCRKAYKESIRIGKYTRPRQGPELSFHKVGDLAKRDRWLVSERQPER